MNADMQTMSQKGTQMTNSFLSSDGKYGGLIKQKPSKKIRNSLFLLVGYIDSISPPFHNMHIVITFFRFFQHIGPALFAASERFWPKNEIQQKIVSYISVLFHIIPVEYRYESAIFIELIYFIITLFYFVMVLSCAYIYKTTSKLPKFIVIMISIFNGSVMYLIHPIALQMASQELSRLIMGMDTYTNKVVSIIGVIVTYFCSILFCYTFAKIMSITLLFRPSSMLTTSHIPELCFLLSTFVITVLSGLATYLSKIPYVILTFATGIIMVLTVITVFMPASYVKSRDMKLVFCSSITGGIFSLIIGIFGIIDKHASMALLFISIAIFVVALLASSPIIDMFEKKSLKILDDLVDDTSNAAEHFKNPEQLIHHACVGFKYAHPVCLDWSIFKSASISWPEHANVWNIFGKFVAIYPEENNLLSYIIRNIEQKKLKGNFAKQTIAQGKSILTSRETALSPVLKRKMQHVGKAVHHSKRKLRHIWDNVIQGNTHEMEHAVNTAYQTVNKTEAEFMHVLSQYPNNRFIARAYARFLQEIKADLKGFQEWVEKVKILQRGLPATVDNTNVLGIEAFPNLPRVLSVKNDGGGIQTNIETESAFQLDVDIEDDGQMVEQMSGIRDQIANLKIPSLRFISICSILTFLILIVAPVVVIFIYANIYTKSLDDPLEYMYYLSYLRTLTNQLPAFSFRSIFEKYPSDDPIFNTLEYDIDIPSLGNKKETKEQYKFLIQKLTTNLEAIGKFRSFGVGNEIVTPATDRTFKSILPYIFYDNKGNNSEIYVSIQAALMDYTIQLSKLSSLNEVTVDTLKSSIVMNPLVNTETINNAISLSIQCIISYLTDIENKMNKTMLIVLIVLIIFFIIFYTVISIIEIAKIKSNKNQIYSCLTSLPKNVVSGLAESLRILKKDTEGTKTTEVDTEYSKHEDNILKIFASAGDDTSAASDKHVFISCNVILLLIDILLTYFLTEMFKNVSKKLLQNGPHLNYVFGATAYMMEGMNALNVAAVANNSNDFNYSIPSIQLLGNLSRICSYFTYYYQRGRYGGDGDNDAPFPFFNQINEEAVSIYSCKDDSIIPNTYKEIYTCFNPDQQTTLFIGLSQKISLPFVLGNSTHVNSSDQLFDDLWYLTAILLYQSFFSPMFESILPQLKDTINSAIPETLPQTIIFVVLAFIVVVVINAFVSIEINKLKFALSLLLHVQAQIIMQTQKIIDVLNGHFTSKGKDSTTRNSKFFTVVVSSLPDSIIIINNQMQIISVNKSTERIYNVNAEDLINTKINDFLSSRNFSEDMMPVVTNATTIAAAVNPTQVQYTKEQGSTNHLELSCITFNQNYVLTTQDVTQRFVYNTLIESERAKSDQLLASILPPSLVVRVQKGEKNISFAVQSATILFLDIVSFTPWCASNTAQIVMSTLNNMFKLLDNKLATHSTATKIKCIGDCYMCAGGIFSEVNQPNVHAKEIVEFGLESIECIRQLDSEYDLQLQIRVGINTGGPIVAGVLGTEKPTFEILGPAINMAQQMEHHGVPMQVHITRSVYELVYGGSFVIKERGQVEIKSGKVITYLVHENNKNNS